MQTDQSRTTITLADGAGHTFKLLGRAWIMSDNFRLSDAQWAAIAPLLPMVHTGPVRQGVLTLTLKKTREAAPKRIEIG